MTIKAYLPCKCCDLTIFYMKTNKLLKIICVILFTFQVEVEEALDKVLLTLKIFFAFRDAFTEFKGKLPTYFKGDKKPKTWDFQEHLIFKRFDSFVDRLTIIKEFFRTAQQFLKLEKVEMGGIRGKALGTRIINVHEEFKVR